MVRHRRERPVRCSTSVNAPRVRSTAMMGFWSLGCALYMSPCPTGTGVQSIRDPAIALGTLITHARPRCPCRTNNTYTDDQHDSFPRVVAYNYATYLSWGSDHLPPHARRFRRAWGSSTRPPSHVPEHDKLTTSITFDKHSNTPAILPTTLNHEAQACEGHLADFNDSES